MKAWQNLTHMATDGDCAAEMKKKFYGTIMGIQAKDSNKPVYAKYTGYNADWKHHFYTEDDNKIILNQDTETEVFIPDPKRGLYNTYLGVGLFQRLPFRQHKRGLYNETAIVILLRRILLGQYTHNAFDETIYNVLDKDLQRPCSLGSACMHAVEHKSWAMDRSFCVSQSHLDEKGFSIFYEATYIGQVYPESTTIRIDNPLFEQELHDYLANDPVVWRIK